MTNDPKLIDEAKKNPNGWVYVIDKEFKGKENVPSKFIKGAWKVSEKGIIIGNFIPNKDYKKNNKTKKLYKKLLSLFFKK